MATEWQFWLHSSTTNPQIGNAVAAAVDPDTGGNKTFDPNGIKARPIGSSDTEPTRWFATSALRAPVYARALAFIGRTRQQIIDAGLTEAQADDALAFIAAAYTPELLAQARAAMTVEPGPRAQLEGGIDAYMASLGFERIPQSGLTVPS